MEHKVAFEGFKFGVGVEADFDLLKYGWFLMYGTDDWVDGVAVFLLGGAGFNHFKVLFELDCNGFGLCGSVNFQKIEGCFAGGEADGKGAVRYDRTRNIRNI